MKTAKTLVITDRTEDRMQPEIFYSFKMAAAKIQSDKKLAFKFYSFNPYKIDVEPPLAFAEAKQRIMDLLNDLVEKIVEIKSKSKTDKLLFDEIKDYIKEHRASRLAVLYNEINDVLSDFSFLVIESTAKTVVHPIFYNPSVVTAKFGKAEENDIKDTLYGLMFLDAAFEQNKPIFGTCHGAQLGYLHAGGGITKVFDEGGLPYTETFYARSNPNKGPEELWQIDVELNARKRKDINVYSTLKYPLPNIFIKSDNDKEEKFVNKDFRHTLAMTAPIPDKIEVLSFHPLSVASKSPDKMEINEHPKVEKKQSEKFKTTLKKIPIVDAFKYKTLLGFQYHPHYTYDDFNTSEIFDYLINDIIKVVYKENE
ncbi:MAG TPA: gamma-glutamyl-gamma-aminobutyrate hydrolase family protein [Victivallales bacterium]|nr:gamma-glutamyl-gamma-aminobutyrate hydrolase family protein [Victivallales bacterium]